MPELHRVHGAHIAINGFFWGRDATGSGQYLHGLLEALTREGEGNHYRLIIPQTRMRGRGAPSSPRLTVQVASTPFDRLDGNWAKVWFEQIAFPRLCRQMGVDLIHVPYFAPPLFSPMPVVVTIHDLIPLLLPAYRGSRFVRLYMWLVSTAARRAACIVTDSEASRRDIGRTLDIPASRLRVTYLAAGEAYRPISDHQRLALVRERYGLPERYLLYLGGFDVRKNVATLLDAYARARRMTGFRSEIRLVVAGRLPRRETALYRDPRRYTRTLQIERQVVFPGWIEESDKPALYSGAIAFVFPSLREGFGLPLLEALSCGIPVVASNTSSLPEITGDAGLLVAPDDVEGLARAMLRLVTDEGLRRGLADRALPRARAFCWKRTARETLACYSDLLSSVHKYSI